MGQFLLQSLQEGPIFADPLTLDFWLQNCEIMNLLQQQEGTMWYYDFPLECDALPGLGCTTL